MRHGTGIGPAVHHDGSCAVVCEGSQLWPDVPWTKMTVVRRARPVVPEVAQGAGTAGGIAPNAGRAEQQHRGPPLADH